jgi:hypothetical protein
MPVGSNFRLNIDFVRERKIVSGENFPVTRSGRQKFPSPGNFCPADRQITPLFGKCGSGKSRETADFLCAMPAQGMANKDESQSRKTASAGAPTTAQQKNRAVLADRQAHKRELKRIKKSGRRLRTASAQAQAGAPKIMGAMLAHRPRQAPSKKL